MLSFVLLLLIIDPTFNPYKFLEFRFWILDLRYSVYLIKNDRAKRYNKSLRGVGPYGPSGPEAAI